MATTSRPISELEIGIRDTAGAAVASAKCRFYQPGTLTERTVFSDDVCTTPITQPVTCNAGGQATVYTLEPTRMIAKDSTETTTYYDGIVNLNRHDAVYVTHPSINGGAETTLEAALGTFASSAGAADGQYKESSGATARNFPDVIGDMAVSVADFAAVGDLVNDDTAEIQAAIDRVIARGGGVLMLPEGDFLTSSALSITTGGLIIRGAGTQSGGKGTKIHLNSTTANALTINLATAPAASIVIEDIQIVAASASSGSAISIAGATGQNVVIQRCHLGLFRTGIAASGVTGVTVRDCFIDEGDGNGAQIGINAGARATVENCKLSASTDNGVAIDVNGADVRISNCYINNWSVGVWLKGARCNMRGLTVTGQGATGIYADTAANHMISDSYVTAPTGVNFTSSGGSSVVANSQFSGNTTAIILAGANSVASNCIVASPTTGISVEGAGGRVSNCVVTGATTACSVAGVANVTIKDSLLSGTTALTVNASATLFMERDNTFSGTVTNSATSNRRGPWRETHLVTASSVTPVTFTPDITAGQVNIFSGTHAAAAQLVTVAAHATATLAIGDILVLCFVKTGANNMTLTWNAQYTDADASAMTAVTITSVNVRTFMFVWTGSAFRNFLITPDVGV